VGDAEVHPWLVDACQDADASSPETPPDVDVMQTFWIKAISMIVGSCLLGAWVSRLVNQGKAAWWWAAFPAILSGAIWGWMARQKVSLVHASVIYDVTMASTYVVSLWLLGEAVTPMQVLGIVLAVAGVGIMGWT